MSRTIVAKLTVKSGEVEKFTELAREMVSQTRKEKGCISYNLYKDCFSEQQVFVFYEEYEDDDAVKFHNESEYLKFFFKEVTPLLEGEPSINVF